MDIAKGRLNSAAEEVVPGHIITRAQGWLSVSRTVLAGNLDHDPGCLTQTRTRYPRMPRGRRAVPSQLLVERALSIISSRRASRRVIGLLHSKRRSAHRRCPTALAGRV